MSRLAFFYFISEFNCDAGWHKNIELKFQKANGNVFQ